jgi:hypothetical protein
MRQYVFSPLAADWLGMTFGRGTFYLPQYLPWLQFPPLHQSLG